MKYKKVRKKKHVKPPTNVTHSEFIFPIAPDATTCIYIPCKYNIYTSLMISMADQPESPPFPLQTLMMSLMFILPVQSVWSPSMCGH